MNKLEEREEFIPVDLSRLSVGIKIPFRIFVRDNTGLHQFIEKDNLFTAMHLSSLKERGVTKVYVALRDRGTLEGYLQERDYDALIQEKRLKDYVYWKEKYFKIDEALLPTGASIDFSIFVSDSMRFIPLLKVEEGKSVKISEGLIPKNKDILIKASDIYLYERYLKSLEGIDLPSYQTTNLEATVAKERANIVMKDIFDNQITYEKFEVVRDLTRRFIEGILNNKYVAYNLLSLKRLDYYTYLHSVNVGVLSLGLAITAGLSNKDVELLALGAMLHDIGKSTLPPEIINKPSRLNEREFMIYKNHVIEGKRILEGIDRFPKVSMEPVLLHHEKLTGRGYPFRLKEDRIGVFGRITGIADCYDALTTPRLNKYPLTPYNALFIICKETADYDRGLLKEFVKMMGMVKFKCPTKGK